MVIKYSEEEHKNDVIDFFMLKTRDIFYREEILNRKGETKEGTLYSEVTAEIINNKFEKIFSKIESLENKKGYFPNHKDLDPNEEKKLYNSDEKIRQKEKWKAKSYCNIKGKVDGLGKFCYFEMPIKRVNNTTTGDIDLISYNSGTQKINIIELKKDDSTETLLRCIMEIFTYYKQLNLAEVIKQFNENENFKDVLDKTIATKIVPTILIYKNTFASEVAENLNEKYPEQRKLLEKIKDDIGQYIQIFKITQDKKSCDDTIEVEEIKYY